MLLHQSGLGFAMHCCCRARIVAKAKKTVRTKDDAVTFAAMQQSSKAAWPCLVVEKEEK
jgi:hypothetical protein